MKQLADGWWLTRCKCGSEVRIKPGHRSVCECGNVLTAKGPKLRFAPRDYSDKAWADYYEWSRRMRDWRNSENPDPAVIEKLLNEAYAKGIAQATSGPPSWDDMWYRKTRVAGCGHFRH